MRSSIFIILIIGLFILPVFAVSQTSDLSSLVPDYFTSPSTAPTRAIGNNKNGVITITYNEYREYVLYNSENSNPDTNDYQFLYYYQIRANSYGGYLGVVEGYPALYFKSTLKGYGELSGSFTGSPYQWYIVPGTTLFSLYHVDSKDELIAFFVMRAYSSPGQTLSSGSPITVGLYFIHKKYNISTGNYTDIVLYSYNYQPTSVKGSLQYITVEMAIVPAFYSWYNPDENSTYLTFGFKGWFNIYTPYAEITNSKFQFAWTTYRVGPKNQITMNNITSFVEKTRGWYVWVGEGLRYYRPYSSLLETYPIKTPLDQNEKWLSTTLDYSSNKTADEVMSDVSFTCTLTENIEELNVYSYSMDVEKLYSYFKYGRIEEYRGSYLKYGKITQLNTNQMYTLNVIKPLLPVVLSGIILGPWMIKGVAWSDKVFVILSTILGIGMGIYGFAELTSLLLVFLALFFVRKREENPETGGEAG